VSEANNCRPPDPLDEATSALREIIVPPGPRQELTTATVAAVNNRLAGTTLAGEFAHRQRRRKLMRYIGYGTAIVIVVATAAAVFWFSGSSAAAKVQKARDTAAKAKSVRVVVKKAGTAECVSIVQGDMIRNEEPGKSVIITDVKSRKALELDLVRKTARWEDLDDAAVRELSLGLASLGDELGFYSSDKVTELPGEKIGERETKVFAIEITVKDLKGNDLTIKRTLWVDKKTDLPVRFQCHDPTGDLISEFDSWNEEFDPKLFELKVPEGFREVKE